MTLSSQLSLRQRVLSAGAWSLAGYGSNLVIRFGSNLLMTRLLRPEMFGVMAIASVVLTGLGMFSDLGMKPNVVQSKNGDSPVFLNTVWVTQIVRSAIIWCAALCASLLITFLNYWGLIGANSVYSNPAVPPVIVLLSFSMVISGFESTKILQAARHLALRRLTSIEVATQLSSLLAMLAWVSIDPSIWALVAGTLCGSLARTILSHLWLPGVNNRWQWDSASFREIIAFGKWIFLSSALYFFAGSGDRMLLGALVNATILGTYAIAYLFYSSIDTILMRIVEDVSYPALGEVFRKDPKNLINGYYRFHALIASLTYFSAGALFMSGQAIINFLYDPRYHLAGHILEILAVALLTIPFRMATQSFLLLGQARLYFQLNIIRMATLFVAVPLGFYAFGLDGAVWGIVLSYFSSLPMIVTKSIEYEFFDFRREILALTAVIAGVVAGIVLSHLLGVLPHIPWHHPH